MVTVDEEKLQELYKKIVDANARPAATVLIANMKKENTYEKYQYEVQIAELRSLIRSTYEFSFDPRLTRIKDLMTKILLHGLMPHIRPHIIEDIYAHFNDNKENGDWKAFGMAKEGFSVLSNSDTIKLFNEETSKWDQIKLALCLLLVKYDARAVILTKLRKILDTVTLEERKDIDYSFMQKWTSQFYWINNPICDDQQQRAVLLDIYLIAINNHEMVLAPQTFTDNILPFWLSCFHSGDKSLTKLDPKSGTDKVNVVAKIVIEAPIRNVVSSRRLALGLIFMKRRILDKFDSDTKISGFLLPDMFGGPSKIAYGNRTLTADLMLAAAKSYMTSDPKLLREAMHVAGYNEACLTLLQCYQFSQKHAEVIKFGKEFLRVNPEMKDNDLETYLSIHFMLCGSYLANHEKRDSDKAVEHGAAVFKYATRKMQKSVPELNTDTLEFYTVMPETLGFASLQLLTRALAESATSTNNSFLAALNMVIGEIFSVSPLQQSAKECMEMLQEQKKIPDLHFMIPFTYYGSTVHKLSVFFADEPDALETLRNQFRPNRERRCTYELARLAVEAYEELIHQCVLTGKPPKTPITPYDGPLLDKVRQVLDNSYFEEEPVVVPAVVTPEPEEMKYFDDDEEYDFYAGSPVGLIPIHEFELVDSEESTSCMDVGVVETDGDSTGSLDTKHDVQAKKRKRNIAVDSDVTHTLHKVENMQLGSDNNIDKID